MSNFWPQAVEERDFVLQNDLQTQQDLFEKFNTAFYNAQIEQEPQQPPVLFEEVEEIEEELIGLANCQQEATTTGDWKVLSLDFNDQLLEDTLVDDGFFSDGLSELVTPSSDCCTSFTFDYDQFSEHFDNFLQENSPSLPSSLPPIACLTDKRAFDAFVKDGSNGGGGGDFGHWIPANNEAFACYEATDENLNVQVCTLDENLERLIEEAEEVEVDERNCLQCRWTDCYSVWETRSALVRHIEKEHVEVKRGEEFTCFWQDCPRRTKPFNARYKLLIHMRVHSGDKPNKCPFEGCLKAFSRLENLKIHQRSHTGERPYRCQFASCPKSFSNSSDRAKHQRTHFDTRPYACQIQGCPKKYTDPSSLRKHVKNHSQEEQQSLKTGNRNLLVKPSATTAMSNNNGKKQQSFCKIDANEPKIFVKTEQSDSIHWQDTYSTSANFPCETRPANDVKADLRSRLSQRLAITNKIQTSRREFYIGNTRGAI